MAERSRDTVAAPFRAVRDWEDRSWFSAVVTRRGLVAFLAVAIATAASAVHLERYPELLRQQAEARAEARQQTVRPAGEGDGGGLAGGAQEVGPPLGVELDVYIEERHSELAGLAAEGSRIAVVSFEDYADTARILSLLPDGVTVRLAQYRIPAEGESPLETEVVGGDLAASIERAADAAIAPLREEEQEVKKLLDSGTVNSEEYRQEYERRLSELQATRNLLESGTPIVFAVVVEGPVAELQRLVGEPLVRLVDVAPEETELGTSAFFGVRPEDTGRATYGRER